MATRRRSDARWWIVRCVIAVRRVIAAAPVLVTVGAMLIPLRAVAAQEKIVGAVRDTAGTGIAGAEVTVIGTSVSAETDATGSFVLTGVPNGPGTVRVRRLGFTPASADIVVPRGTTAPLTITVTEVARALNPVVVRATRPRRYTGYLAGFYERRDRGFGRFITGDEIEQRDPTRLTDVLRTVPGVTVSSDRLGGSSVRLRGNRCAPLVWLDGAPAAAAEFDLDALAPTSVAGIEIYPGPSTVPAEFVLPFGPTGCGTILVWSRRGEPREQRNPITAAELANLVAKLQVYTADQVDEPARVDSAAPIVPLYPDSLYKAQVSGRVVAEFVVDTTGRARIETFGVVSSTDPRFTEAVRRALPEARFTPARLHGRTVPQIVRQPFAFVVPAAVTNARP